ncbi:MAG TPA: glycoside hydrolase family 99-like domain-containing protein [Prolixibacteraceae bacterium]|nr:glycoside hydrolase family 99-like domain-containing protein [Prolixibacteraceae bacterium]
MKNLLIVLCLCFFALSFLSCKTIHKNTESQKITVAAYYFPNYHTNDPRNSKTLGSDWSEWELLKAAQPHFEGHDQPKVPLWGYTDEKDPSVMSQKIQTAADYGIDCFIFDWYRYEDGPFLNRCLDEGFLKAGNVNQIKFAFMWANHDWVDIFPYTRGKEQKLLYPGKVSPGEFERIGDELIARYFTLPNYWKIKGKAYFSIYDIQNFIASFGSLEATRAAMEKLNQKAIAAGLKGIHWNLVAWGQPLLPGEKVPADIPGLITALGFSSATSYVWVHHVSLAERQTDYNQARDDYFTIWEKAKKEYPVPYYPNVSMGWDPSPRCDNQSEWGNFGYPFTYTIGNNTPENFRKALQLTKDKLHADPNGPRIMNINSWNEWTEGSYIEPDTMNKFGYLEAIKAVFK